MKTLVKWGAMGLALAVLLTAGAAFAQTTTGNIFGKVVDEQGAPLPGATVTVSGVGAPRTMATDERGEFRFPGLSIGAYHLTASLDGFSTVEQANVAVGAGRSTTVEISLNAAITDVITVTTETPLMDERKISVGATVSALELEKIPSARDPWAMLTQTPGVRSDRINVGGNEGGQQAVFTTAGANTDDTTWAVDGVNITDMSAIASPQYYDFEAFEELQFTNGGSDVSLESSGVTVNIVTRRGTNEWRGSARYLQTDGDWQSDPNVDAGDFGRNNNGDPLINGGLLVQDPTSYVPNAIGEVTEYGLEFGGRLVRDRLWFWGAYGQSDPIDNIVGSTGQHDLTELDNRNGKLNAQITRSTSANAQYSFADKIKDGRGAGATRAPETTTNQSGPTKTSKAELSQVFNSNFYVTGLYSLVDGGFALIPKGGIGNPVWMEADGVYRGSYYFLDNDRDVTQLKLDASTFATAGSTSHELKFGASQRNVETTSLLGFSGNFWVYDCSLAGCVGALGANTRYLNIWRDANSVDEAKYQAGWVQDTASWGNLTMNAGLRYETATGEMLNSQIDGVTRGGITFLPGLTGGALDPGVEFSVVMPRFGATYALGAERQTLLRASLARFSQQFLTTNYSRLSSLGGNSRLAGCLYVDSNANFVVDPGEVGSITGCSPVGFNPANPNSVLSSFRTDPNLEPALTDELLLGIEHSLRPEFVVTAGITLRRVSDMQESQPLVRENGVERIAQRSDFLAESQVVGGRRFDYFVYRPGVRRTGGTFLTNGDREQEAFGANLGFQKRLSNHWMARGYAQYTDWTWVVPDSYFDHNDPTDFGDGGAPSTTNTTADGNRDGEIVAERSGGSGSKGNVYLNAKWSFNLTGLYQFAPDRPWGFDASASLNGRQGYPNPIFISLRGSDGINRSVQVSKSLDDDRLDNVMTLDLRLDKTFSLRDFGVTVGVDIFNALNDTTVLQRGRSATAGSYTFIQETVSPRILRAGVRLTFR